MSDASTRAHQLETEELLREIKEALPAKPITNLGRSAFFRLPHAEQSAFLARGGKIHDDPPPPRAPLPANGIRRSDFDKLGHAERHKLILGGQIVVD